MIINQIAGERWTLPIDRVVLLVRSRPLGDGREEPKQGILLRLGETIEAEPLDDTATQAGTRSPPSDENTASRRPHPAISIQLISLAHCGDVLSERNLLTFSP